ncbi:TPA: methyltransferase domain-containing protein [Candidatus Poribacteria bacterium]|nr:methyltransferase domain-containing protein [Candidatus Poribacteria bacterium]
MSPIYEAVAEQIVRETEVKRGYCFLLGCGTGRLAFELAKRTELIIYGIEPDRKNVEKARAALDAASLYGTRVTVGLGSLSDLPYSDYFANLIVSDEMLLSGNVLGSAEEIFRILKPCGGIAYLGQSKQASELRRRLEAENLRQWLSKAGITDSSLRSRTGFEVTEENGVWAKIERGPLPGAGSWTHQYANPSNTACSDDQLVKCPLWEREIEGAIRTGMGSECGNLAATDDSLFVAVGEKCLRLDAETGDNRMTYFLPPSPVKHLAINLGAPGDRRDKNGTLWLSYPRPSLPLVLKFDMQTTILPNLGYFQLNPEGVRIEGTDKPWLFSYGCCGLSRCVIPLIAKGKEPGIYTVRLGFAELADVREEQRVFDIKLQDRVVLKDFDIFKEAGAPNKAVIKEFKGMNVKKELLLELVTKAVNPTVTQAPMLNFIEVVRED